MRPPSTLCRCARRRPSIRSPSRRAPAKPSRRGKPFALDGIRVLDFTWFLASAGGTRFLSSFGAECLKVEIKSHPDTRLAAMAPIGGREAREKATAPLRGVTDPDMGGQFNNKNPGKRGISLNVRHPKGLEIARRLVAMSDIVAEGFSPGVLDAWGLGYDELKAIKPDIIYVQQSGMGAQGKYGRFRTVGPIANAFAGLSEMSGLPEPAMPAGWGYSYLDWMGAYSFALAMLSALYHRERTGEGQWIDASQTEVGLFISGTAILDWSANGRIWSRTGNRSPLKPAAPHGAYPCAGVDRWIAIACFSDAEWRALTEVAKRPDWASDARFATLAGRLQHQDALDILVGEWTKTGEARQLMLALAESRRAGGRLPDGGGSLRQRSATRPPRVADRGHRHQDRAMAGRRGAGEAQRKPRLRRRAHRPRRTLLRRGQRVRLWRVARDDLAGDQGAGRRGRVLVEEVLASRLPRPSEQCPSQGEGQRRGRTA